MIVKLEGLIYLTLIYYVLKSVSLFMFLAIENETAKEVFKYRIFMFVRFMGIKCQ